MAQKKIQPTITPAQRAADNERRVADKARRARNEKARRERIRKAGVVLEYSGLAGAGFEPDVAQRRRASDCFDVHTEYSPDAVERWIRYAQPIDSPPRPHDLPPEPIIIDNTDPTPPPPKPKAARTQDTDAKDFAAAAHALAPEMKSKFAPWQARAFLDSVEHRRDPGGAAAVLARRTDVTGAPWVAFGLVALRQMALHGLADSDMRAALRQLGEGTKAFWGRKLALFLLLADQRSEAAEQG